MGKQGKKRKERRAHRQQDVQDAPKLGDKLTFKYTTPGMLDGVMTCGDCGGPMVSAGDQYACMTSLEPEELVAAGINPEIDHEGSVVGGHRIEPCACCPPGKQEIVLDLGRFSGDRDKLIAATKKFNVFVSLE